MPQRSDISITVPSEHYDALAAVISAGLQHATIKADVRNELRAWWNAEKEFIECSIDPDDNDE